jgi:hypothetical protein
MIIQDSTKKYPSPACIPGQLHPVWSEFSFLSGYIHTLLVNLIVFFGVCNIMLLFL